MRTDRRAFTLIELLICMSIIMLFSGSMYALHNTTSESRRALLDRHAARDGAGLVLHLWREDVSAAARIEPADAGRAMLLQVGETPVRWAWREGWLSRQAGTAPAHRLLEADGAQFGRVDRGPWSLAFHVELDNGLQTRPLRFSALAVPAAPQGVTP